MLATIPTLVGNVNILWSKPTQVQVRANIHIGGESGPPRTNTSLSMFNWGWMRNQNPPVSHKWGLILHSKRWLDLSIELTNSVRERQTLQPDEARKLQEVENSCTTHWILVPVRRWDMQGEVDKCKLLWTPQIEKIYSQAQNEGMCTSIMWQRRNNQ